MRCLGRWEFTRRVDVLADAAAISSDGRPRAVNLAVDRVAYAVDATGGPDAGDRACQVLPAGLPGHRPVCPFNVAPTPAGVWIAPDRSEAERLVAASGARGARIDVAAPIYASAARGLLELSLGDP